MLHIIPFPTVFQNIIFQFFWCQNHKKPFWNSAITFKFTAFENCLSTSRYKAQSKNIKWQRNKQNGTVLNGIFSLTIYLLPYYLFVKTRKREEKNSFCLKLFPFHKCLFSIISILHKAAAILLCICFFFDIQAIQNKEF